MDFEYAGLAIVPIMIALIEVMKKLGMPDKFAPIPSVIMGLAAGIIFIKPDDLKSGIITGLYMGLSACGLFSIGKNTAQAIKGK